MERHKINPDDKIQFGEMEILSIEENSASVYLTYTVNKIFPDENLLKINNFGKEHVLHYKNQVVIELLDIKKVICEDWFEDETIPKSSANGNSIIWNETAEIAAYNVVRTIGYGLTQDYTKFIDLEFAKISAINKTIYEDESLFEIVVNTSYTHRCTSSELLDFHTGPFKFYCKEISLVID